MARDGGRRVLLWFRDASQAADVASRRENVRYLPGVPLPEGVEVTADLDRALVPDDIVVAAPSAGVRALIAGVGPRLRPGHRLCSVTKGLAEDGRRMSELWSDVTSAHQIAVLSGPNISREVAAGLPAPTVIASSSPDTARRFQEIVSTPMFRAYTNADVTGVEICGALKNIIAIGAGAIDGMQYGDNAKAGFVTRGLAEIARYAFAAGGSPLTAAGLAGFGDLIATCTSGHSRNRVVGELLAKGMALADIRGRLGGQVAEGIGTTVAVRAASRQRGVEMPIAEQTYSVLFEDKPVRQAMRELMDRERGEEISGPLAELSRDVMGAARRSPPP